jgi:restriction endonuclease S subunit
MKAISPESNDAELEAKNKNLLEEVAALKFQVEVAQRALEEYQTRVEDLTERMVEYRELWKNLRRENELLKREVPSDGDYPCYSQSRPEDGSSPYPYNKYNQLE